MNIQTIELNADLPRNLEPYEISNVKYYISNSKGIILMNSHQYHSYIQSDNNLIRPYL